MSFATPKVKLIGPYNKIIQLLNTCKHVNYALCALTFQIQCQGHTLESIQFSIQHKFVGPSVYDRHLTSAIACTEFIQWIKLIWVPWI